MVDVQEMVGADIHAALKEAIHALAEAAAEQQAAGSALVNPKQKAAQFEHEAFQALNNLTKNYAEAGEILASELKIAAKTDPSIHYDAIAQEMKHVGNNLNMKNFEALAKQAEMQTTMDPRQLFQISDETCNAFFIVAKHLLDNKQFEKACTVFSLLSNIEPNDFRFWVGYGHSAFHTEKHDVALLAYYMASSLDAANPWPLI